MRAYSNIRTLERRVKELEAKIATPIHDFDYTPALEAIYPMQQWIADCEVRNVLYSGPSGGGKLLSTDTPILTPSGWSTMGELRVGDRVFGADGRPTKVVWVSETQYPTDNYILRFDRGEAIHANAEHLWHCYTNLDRTSQITRTDEWRDARRERRPSMARGRKTMTLKQREAWTRMGIDNRKEASQGKVRTTAEMVSYHEDQQTKARPGTISIKRAAPLQFPSVLLPIPPYVLGAWLGDGTARSGAITGMDDEIFAEIEREGYALGEAVRKPDNIACTRNVKGLIADLRSYNLLQNNHSKHTQHLSLIHI